MKWVQKHSLGEFNARETWKHMLKAKGINTDAFKRSAARADEKGDVIEGMKNMKISSDKK